MTILSTACGVQVYRPSIRVDPYDAREITDRDIEKAFQARPQLQTPAVVALYEMGARDPALAGRVKALRGVRTIYGLPSLLVEGVRSGPRGAYAHDGASRVVSLKKLRLLSAHARADLLMLSSTTVEREILPNWLVSFSPLIVTSLALPMYHVRVKMKREVLLVDVRNGYLYEQVTLTQKASERYVFTLAFSSAMERLEKRVRAQLREPTLARVGAVLGAAAPVQVRPSPARTGTGKAPRGAAGRFSKPG